MNYFHKKNINVVSVDTENWRKNPLVLVKLVFLILLNPNAKYIIATNNMSSYRVLQIMSLFPRKRSVIYWIIGGSIAEWIKEGKVKAKHFKIVNVFLAEGKKMQHTFSEVGFKNTIYVPNFKSIEYLPEIKKKIDNKIRFVFLSRIIPEKGCNTIIEAVRILNEKYKDDFVVDFMVPLMKNIKRYSRIKYLTYTTFHIKVSWIYVIKRIMIYWQNMMRCYFQHIGMEKVFLE